MVKRFPIYLRAIIRLRAILTDRDFDPVEVNDGSITLSFIKIGENGSNVLILMTSKRILIDTAYFKQFQTLVQELDFSKKLSGDGWQSIIKNELESLRLNLVNAFTAFRWHQNSVLDQSDLNKMEFHYSYDNLSFYNFKRVLSIPLDIQIIQPLSTSELEAINNIREPIYHETLKLARSYSYIDKSMALIFLTMALELGLKAYLSRLDTTLDLDYKSGKATLEIIKADRMKYGMTPSDDDIRVLNKMMVERNFFVHARRKTREKMFQERYVLVMRILYWTDAMQGNRWAITHATTEYTKQKDVRF